MSLGFAWQRHALAGLCALAACADLSSKTDLLGQPVVLQEMVTSSVDPAGGYLDTLTDAISGYMLFYGNQTDFDLCYFFDPSNGLNASTICADPARKCVCPMTHDVAMTCQTSGSFAGHCVDPATSAPPPALHATPVGASIRLVVGDLLDGATLEHFACACQGDVIADPEGNVLLDPTACDGIAWSDDPKDCGVCPGDAQHKGRCVDVNGDGHPDWSSLIPGVATVQCGAITHVSTEGEGFYYPDGDQFPSSVTGYAGLGPAIVLIPAGPLPTDSDCTVTISASVKDQSGRSLVQPSPVPIFHTEPLTLSPLAPGDAGTVQIKASSVFALVSFTFNAPIDPTSIQPGDVTVTDTNSSQVYTATDLALPPKGGGQEVDATVSIPLSDTHVYQVTVRKTVSDTFGKPLPDDAAWTFEAVAPPPE